MYIKLIKGGLSIKDIFLRKFLIEIKTNISKGNFRFAGERYKNKKFLLDNGLNINNVKETIMQLGPNELYKGPEEDRDGSEGYVLIFKTDYLMDEFIYIKLKYEPPDNVVCISFHEDEKNLE